MNETILMLNIQTLLDRVSVFIEYHLNDIDEKDKTVIKNDAINLALSTVLFHHNNFYMLFVLSLGELELFKDEDKIIDEDTLREFIDEMIYQAQLLTQQLTPNIVGLKIKTFTITNNNRFVKIVYTKVEELSIELLTQTIIECINNGEHVPLRIRRLINAEPTTD